MRAAEPASFDTVDETIRSNHYDAGPRMNTRTRPLFLDTTVLSNFASSESIDCLTTMVDGGMVVPAVRDELPPG